MSTLSITGARLLKLEAAKASGAARRVFNAANVGDVDVAITFVLDREMRALNRRWRRVDRPTDVLSFSAMEGELVLGDDRLLGDLVISTETAARQAKAWGHSVAVEVGVLVCHGLLHLCGLDHERGEAEAERQLAVEMNVLSNAGLPVRAALSSRHLR
ncbi:MAG: rRNA maturation RNase YbeY [Deltaproteobacteria bacterium]|nr:rRNA maturation RNase YbeY [Deltaproteobacteria bacterium]